LQASNAGALSVFFFIIPLKRNLNFFKKSFKNILFCLVFYLNNKKTNRFIKIFFYYSFKIKKIWYEILINKEKISWR
ncbi:hypothetical protein, partial [Moritella viscosa]|uniref:hypothetical protein n=1 Tax=Moritella viscosa TaxID=80854 RepID=UPI001BAACF77